MSSQSLSSFFSQLVDDHIDWLGAWHRMAFFDLAQRATHVDDLMPPQSFSLWRHAALEAVPHDQPVIDRIAAVYEQLHTLARLVLVKTPDGETLARNDYETVMAKYAEFMQGLRRLERAFSAAAATLDPLTGLRSRQGMEDELQREQSRFMRTGKSFCIAIMDVDHFKNINDTHGHDAGDHVLAAVADHISHSLRPFDDAYRLGGEEFLLCLKETGLETGLVVLERLRTGLEKKAVVLANGQQVPVTASFGLAVSTKDVMPEALIKKADQALYHAKEGGRNKIEVFKVDVG